MTRRASILALLGALAIPFMVSADGDVQKVHVVERTKCAGTIEVISDTVCDTLTTYTPSAPPLKAGWTFVYWTGYPTAEARITGDFWTYPQRPSLTVYGEMTLTANYVPTEADSNGNGIPDWQEIYWNVEDYAIDSDRDGDGYGLKDELAHGTNPWIADSSAEQGIAYADSGRLVYNPGNLPTCVIKSEPEGVLFDTISNAYVSVGSVITTPTLDPRGSIFAYWAVNGVRMCDEFGVALNEVSFEMPNSDVMIVAVTEDDVARRMRLHYYGSGTGNEDDDTDGDGLTFREETAQGVSPRFANESQTAGISYAESGLVHYNPNNLRSYVVKSDPEGMLFDTIEGEYVTSGTVITTPVCDPRTSGFAYWSLNGIRQCDEFGVALCAVTAVVTNEDVELVAVTEANDSRRMQLYWHGRMVGNDADMDGDGLGFAAEVAQGTNPNFADVSENAGISYAESVLVDYNPHNLHNYVIRSEPEGVLFDTIILNYVAGGTAIITPTCSPQDSSFAYWTLNGVRQCDEYGVAVESVAMTMPGEDIELVAVTIDDESQRIGGFWFGDILDMHSDLDGDGFYLEAENLQGTSPVFANVSMAGGISYAETGLIDYNPNNLHSYTIKSEPEGALFDTMTSGLVASGTAILTPECDPIETAFAYWTVNGVRQADVHGVALKQLSLTVGSDDMEIVAVTAGDTAIRNSLYWYGYEMTEDSDTDGDGWPMRDEFAQGTSPVFANLTMSAGIGYADSGIVEYNPSSRPTCVIRSEPEGALFDTVRMALVNPGTTITTPDMSGELDRFACWKLNDVLQRDEYGRAKTLVSLAMPSEDVEIVAIVRENPVERLSLFWYGNEGQDGASDTDDDGLTFADEIAGGTSPTFKNETTAGGVAFSDTEVFEVNLQPYEQVQGAVVDDKFKEIFTSPVAGNEATSETFGEDLQPIVCDLNGDGLFDLVLVYKAGYKTFVNIGYHGNPEFEERKDASIASVDVAMNSVEKLYSLTLDIEPVNELSATTNGAALLVSDIDGRIWYYEGDGDLGTGSGYVLKHKVWGGSHAGFAEGLRLAAVDWDEDGDLDCLAGTADGKLMLLRDPRVGRPTNFKAEAGVDTVVLTWDPNRQSRIRGYRLYRANGESEDFGRIAEPQLPTYRDAPPEIKTYDYKVSSVSRFYTAGNSTPIVTESPMTEAVSATLGGVTFNWRDVNAKVGERVEVVISIENALNYNVAGKSESLAYDSEYLRPVEVIKSGITENVGMTDLAHNGSWTVTMTNGVLPAGSGRFLTFVFDALKDGTTTVGNATVEISAAPRYFLGDVNGDGALNVEDVRLLAKLKNGNGRKWTADQLKAGDFNGNGKLDNADYQALRKLLKDKGVL